MSWIEVAKELPPPNTRVELSYGLFGVRGAVCDDWISEGWITKSGIWSIKMANRVTKHSKPSHWRYLKKKINN